MDRARKANAISMILVAALVFTVVLNLIYMNATATRIEVPEVSAMTTSGLSKTNVNMDAVREQYLNRETVEFSPAAYDGQRWVVVNLEGDSLYDEFKKSSRFSEFSEFVKSIEAQKALASIKAKQTRFLNKLDKNGIDYVCKYSYSTLSVGVAIKVDAASYNFIESMSGVEDIYCSERYAVPKYEAVENNANVYSSGIYSTKDLEGLEINGEEMTFGGQGMAVAILDTGLDRTHEAFNPDTFKADYAAAGLSLETDVHFTRDAIESTINQTKNVNGSSVPVLNAVQRGAGINDVFYNIKVPFAYDYADDDAEVFPAYSNHGTHVAGIVAGKDDSYKLDGPDGIKDTADDETFVGVAPLAQLVICKVFTDDLFDEILGGADGIDILAALEDCATLGVDVINMSLGTSCGFSDEKTDSRTNTAYNKIREMGISLVCAASNDYSSGFGGGNGTNLSSNPDSGTVGSPSTYFSSLSVASINGQMSRYLQGNGDPNQVAFITNSSDGDGNRIEFIEALHEYLTKTYGQAAYDAELARNGQASADSMLRGGEIFKKGERDDLRLKYVLIDGVGRPSSYTTTRAMLQDRTFNGEPVDGTIALIKRGDTTFEEKVEEAMTNGADAVIIYNNVSGTINMSLGEIKDPIPTCLITMDAAVEFVNTAKNNGGYGFVDVSFDFQAGPFMSDFSSWGPVSDLTLKPEITAHGGEITSSVPGAYDVLSGTSMASPNMAGAVAVLRQYLKKTTNLSGRELNARVNQVLMSTATIARNEEGNPYSPRKQGAGLAGIKDAVLSEGYITVRPNPAIYSTEDPRTADSIVDGWLDKTKLELLDDPDKKGEYVLTFTVHNTSSETQKYVPTTYVMTETMASDNKTVAEKAYMLTDMCVITYSGAGYANGVITVEAGQAVEITATVKLGPDAIAYMEHEVTREWIENGKLNSLTEKAFKNGMYVEGFVSLDNVTYDSEGKASDKGVTLGVPYLAFYGDWTAAPLFDFDIYEVSDSEANNAIELEDKLKATSLASQVIGRYHNNDYILPLGFYLYEMDEEEDDIYPAREKIALSMYDEEGSYTVYELYAAYAGLLRNASTIKTVIRNRKTGELVFEQNLENVGKAYSAGGANRGAFVRYEINPVEFGWQNNDEFYVTLEGWLDYKDENGNYAQSTAKDDERQTAWDDVRNTFEFPLTIDYEAPQILDYKIRFDSYEEYDVTKYRVYLDLEVYDNQYVMAVLPCYLKEETEGRLGNYLTLLTEYPIPVYGTKGTSSTVSVEITDYYKQFGLKGDLYIQVEDYAMNAEAFNISLDEYSLTYPDASDGTASTVEFSTSDGRLRLTGYGKNFDDTLFPQYEIELSPFELYTLDLTTADDNYIFQNLEWKGMSDNVIAYGSEIYALKYKEGNPPTTLVLKGDKRNDQLYKTVEYKYAEVSVVVRNDTEGELPTSLSLSFRPVIAGDNHVVNTSTEGYVEVNPRVDYEVRPELDPWYFDKAYEAKTGKQFTYRWVSDNEEIATVKADSLPEMDRNNEGEEVQVGEYLAGIVYPIKEGTVSVTCIPEDENYSYLFPSITFIVGEDYYVNNYYMYEWYGDETVELPSDVNVMYLDEDCFKNDKTITDVILPPMLQEIPNYAFENCVNLKSVTIPSQCTTIGPFAFSGCTSLETIIFPEYVDINKDTVPGYYGSITVGHYAFAGCEKLKYFKVQKVGADGQITLEDNSTRMTAMYDGAFEDCIALESIDLSKLRIVGEGVFSGCVNLEHVTTSASTVLGTAMFEGCEKLGEFEFEGNRLPDRAFNGCGQLDTFTFKGTELLSIGERALAGTAITELQLPAGTYTIGSHAFADCQNLATVKFADNSNVTFTGENPFAGCQKLEGFEESAGYTIINGALYKGDTLISVPSGTATYSFPAGITKIGPSALSGTAITTIDLSGITEIGAYAFAGSKLQNLSNWPDNILEIPEGAFANCTELGNLGSNFAKVTKIGAHAFEGCTKLSGVTFNSATEIGAYAFAYDEALNSVGASALKTLGDYAFLGSNIRSAVYRNLENIGEGAFEFAARLTRANLGPVKNMGSHAFYGAIALTTVTFESGTTTIGDYAFSTFDPLYDNYNIFDAYMLPDDQKYRYFVWQNYMNITKSTTLTSVSLPGTVTAIGAYAFTGQAGITTLELGGVKTVGEGAFRLCSALDGLNLTNVTTIGDSAFRGTSLTRVHLDNATEIGAYAFAGGDVIENTMFTLHAHMRTISGGNISELTIPKATKIGDYAFAGNKIRSVTLSQDLTSRTYTYTENLLDKKGRVDWSRERVAQRLGEGVFAYNTSLTAINMPAGNPAFVSIDGVLYSYIDDITAEEGAKRKLELVAFPGGKSVENGSYKVADDTVEIGGSAFEGVNSSLNTVEFPYTLKYIGSAAFFDSSVVNYIFNSVEAPVLRAANDSYASEFYKGVFAYMYYNQIGHYPWTIDEDSEELEMYLDLENIVMSAMYSNFSNYVFFNGYGQIFFDFSGASFNPVKSLSFTVPRNGIGYDSALYLAYDPEPTPSENDMKDDNVYAVEEAFAALKELLDDFNKASTLTKEQLEENSPIVKAAKKLREAYNMVSGEVQLAFVQEQYQALLSYEKALREAKQANGIDVKLVENGVRITKNPNRTIYYIGDTFDPAGLEIQVKYSDGSELRLDASNNRITIENGYINYDENEPNKTSQTVWIVYHDDFTGGEQRFGIRVTVRSSTTPVGPDPSGPDDPSNPDGEVKGALPTWSIAVIAVGAVLVVAIAVTAVLLALRRRRKDEPEKSSDNGSEKEEKASASDESKQASEKEESASKELAKEGDPEGSDEDNSDKEESSSEEGSEKEQSAEESSEKESFGKSGEGGDPADND